jgi:hypothetical protein
MIARSWRCLLAALLVLGPAMPASATSLPNQWQEVRPAAGGFAAQMPGTPLNAQGETRSQSHELLAISNFFEVDAPDGRAYQISYADLQPAFRAKFHTPDEIIDNARNLALTRAHGRSRQDKAIVLSGNYGREVIFDVRPEDTNRDISVRIRYYLVKDRLYQLTTVSPRGTETDADANHFFDSFRFAAAEPAAAPPPAKRKTPPKKKK